MVEKKLIPGYHARTLRLIEVMETGKIGDVLTDAQLREIAGEDCDPKGPAYAQLQSAIRYCLRVPRIVWQRQAKAGLIKCLGPAETVSLAGVRNRHAARTGRKTLSVLSTVILDALDAAGKQRHAQETAVAGIMATAGSAPCRAVLAQAADPHSAIREYLIPEKSGKGSQHDPKRGEAKRSEAMRCDAIRIEPTRSETKRVFRCRRRYDS